MIEKLKNSLRHLFLPHESNNHRARFLHHQSLFITVLLLLGSSFFLSEVRNVTPEILGVSHNVTLDELLLITNQKRIENNLPALSLNAELSLAAQKKAEDMLIKDYWAHNSPDGATPWKFIRDAGYNYLYAGENLARGFSSGSEVVNAWMDSPSHRQNMLSENYQDVGFAVVTGKLGGEETVLVVQEFGSRRSPSLAQRPQEASRASQAADDNTLEEKSEEPEPEERVASKLPEPELEQKPLINSINFTSNASRAMLIFFTGVFAVDMIAIERRKIIRFVGHNLDHIIFLMALFGILAVITSKAIL